MNAITPDMVKQLRSASGAGMMDCKKALVENKGAMDAAADWLRAKGLVKAGEKSQREAVEGLVGAATHHGYGVVVEVNSQTDFVARNKDFQSLVDGILARALVTPFAGAQGGTGNANTPALDNKAALLRQPFDDSSATSIEDKITSAVATIGENITLGRVCALKVETGVVAGYVHNKQTSNLGSLGVLVALQCETDNTEALQALGRQLAMHVAAAKPLAVEAQDINQDYLRRERAVFVAQAEQSGKPAEVIEKMVTGRVQKLLKEKTLLAQTFVVDGERSVAQVLQDEEKSLGAPITVTGFCRVALGEDAKAGVGEDAKAGVESSQDDSAPTQKE